MGSTLGSSVFFLLTGKELAGIGGSSPVPNGMNGSHTHFPKMFTRCLFVLASNCPEKPAPMPGLFGPSFACMQGGSQSPVKMGLPPGAQPMIHLTVFWPKNIPIRNAVRKGNCVFNNLLQPFPVGVLLCLCEGYRVCDNACTQQRFPNACVQ